MSRAKRKTTGGKYCELLSIAYKVVHHVYTGSYDEAS